MWGYILLLLVACTVADPLAIYPRDMKQLIFRPNEFAAGIRTPGTHRMTHVKTGNPPSNIKHPDSIVCTNVGVDWRGEVTWKCEATMENAKLGRTEISWENYPTKDSSTVLRGSEALEYELIPVAPAPPKQAPKTSDHFTPGLPPPSKEKNSDGGGNLFILGALLMLLATGFLIAIGCSGGPSTYVPPYTPPPTFNVKPKSDPDVPHKPAPVSKSTSEPYKTSTKHRDSVDYDKLSRNSQPADRPTSGIAQTAVTAPKDDTWTGSRTLDTVVTAAATNYVMNALRPTPKAAEIPACVPVHSPPARVSREPFTSNSVTSTSFASSKRR